MTAEEIIAMYKPICEALTKKLEREGIVYSSEIPEICAIMEKLDREEEGIRCTNLSLIF